MTTCRFAAVLGALALVAACGSEPPPPPPTGGGVAVDAATAGRVSGRVTFEGTPPPADVLRMGTDPACVADGNDAPLSDAVLVGDAGGVQNTFVYISDGIDPQYSFEIPTDPVVLDQVGFSDLDPAFLGARADGSGGGAGN